MQFTRDTPQESLSSAREGNWREELALLGIIATSSEEKVATSSDPLSSFGDMVAQEFLYGYASLKGSGAYSPEKGAALGSALGANVRAPSDYSLHSEEELTLDTDTSRTRVLEYRSDMRDALSSLVNGAPPEFETYALYIETKDPERLQELRDSQDRYLAAEADTLQVVVPQDAGELHIRAVNALGSYAHMLDQLIRYADSPFTSLVILRTYNEAEREMLYAFDALSSYYVRKSIER